MDTIVASSSAINIWLVKYKLHIWGILLTENDSDCYRYDNVRIAQKFCTKHGLPWNNAFYLENSLKCGNENFFLVIGVYNKDIYHK